MSDGLRSGLIAHVGTLDQACRSSDDIVADLSVGELRRGAAPAALLADLSAFEREPDPSPMTLVTRLAGAEFDAPPGYKPAED